MLTTITKVERVLNSKLTSYKIAKDCGLSTQLIDSYRTGKSKVENMALGKAEILASYYDEHLKGNVISMNKSQWVNLARHHKTLESAKEFLGSHVFGWSSKESALQTFKHEILKDNQRGRLQKDERVPLGEKPDEVIPWLKELSVDDLADI